MIHHGILLKKSFGKLVILYFIMSVLQNHYGNHHISLSYYIMSSHRMGWLSCSHRIGCSHYIGCSHHIDCSHHIGCNYQTYWYLLSSINYCCLKQGTVIGHSHLTEWQIASGFRMDNFHKTSNQSYFPTGTWLYHKYQDLYWMEGINQVLL
jgi:hypothetical protein